LILALGCGTLAAMTNNAETSDKIFNYEVGFLIIPTLSQDQVTTVIDSIKSSIAAHGGEITSEAAPTMRQLAYEMAKAAVGKKNKYKAAYFGWIVFKLSSDKAAGFKSDLEKIEDLLRFLFIRKDRETVFLTPQDIETQAADEATAAEDATKAKDAEKAPEVAEDLDRKIDNLVVE
jgi:ribosomal protein S6